MDAVQKMNTKVIFPAAYIGARDDIVNLIPVDTAACLDIGCSIGTLGASLKSRSPHIHVTGIERNQEMAEKARMTLDRVLIYDLNNVLLAEHLNLEQFDCVVFADILEHLIVPSRLLREVSSGMKRGGDCRGKYTQRMSLEHIGSSSVREVLASA